MSSPPSSTYFLASSPLLAQSPSARRRQKSRFTYKHLSTLSHSATNCPLRVIAHIDLDAFYAQCETVRLGVDPALPLAVQQWQGLIAINYPARAYGLNRHVTITEAKEKCPEIICQHVATWKEGDTKWSYSDDAFKEIATRKVSLDPYRIQSRKILALIKENLPKDTQRVGKASIDEVFLDLSAQVHSILLERYPELRGPTPYDDPSEPLPRPPTTVLDWQADALVDLDSSQNEEDDPDWDDICMLIASEIVRDVRAKIYAELKYTCSAGISRNKMLAKLGSGHKKPNSQTVIRNRAVQHFLSGFKFTKIRNLGGKLGDEVVAAFNTEMVSELLSVPIEQLKKQLGDDTGSWLHNVIRGEDSSEVNPRTQIKSMLSAKSFRPSINSFEVACKWLRIFVADIFSRLVEEGVLEHKRRPKTINLHHRQGQSTRSKSAPIPSGRQITEDGLFDLAKNLLAQVVVDGRAWPCANLSLSVGGFEHGVTGNKGIGGFLVHGEEAKALRESHVDEDRQAGILGKSIKVKTKGSRKRKRGQEGVIANFFGKAPIRQESTHSETTSEIDGSSEDEKDVDSAPAPREPDANYDEGHDPATRRGDGQTSSPSKHLPPLSSHPRPPDPSSRTHQQEQSDHPTPSSNRSGVDTYMCSRCSSCIPLDDKTEHEDFHFAQDLQNEAETDMSRDAPNAGPPRGGSSSSGRGRGRRGRGRPPRVLGNGAERGQKRLAFG
ncbi:sister chromatid cohesion protein Eso1 [Teratosphaeria nubilosa]|uniref:DNA polymerase eta n=1 Tax=Teratosphaeria nubilosa TaxID=161662 RepID=A0A6G1KVI4_9PEZI|nr:sister chromatid cohesion protein Eso1 [Teratosphaeria nubilosa]